LLEWRNWQTHGTQNPAPFIGHESSTLSSSTSHTIVVEAAGAADGKFCEHTNYRTNEIESTLIVLLAAISPVIVTLMGDFLAAFPIRSAALLSPAESSL
jgi:hypothetical protein